MSDPSAPANWALPRGLIVLLTLAAATVVVGGIREIAGLAGPVFLALVLTIAVHPLRDIVARRGWPRWTGTVVGLLAVYAILIGLTIALVGSLARFATLLPEYQDEFDDLVSGLRSWLDDIGVSQDQTDALIDTFDIGKLVDFTADLIGSLLSVLSSLFFIITLLLFMGLEAGSYPSRLRTMLPARAPVFDALLGFATGTRTYLVVSSVFGFIVAVIDTLVLWLLGIPVPVLWGLLAFITNYIPNVGFVIGLIPPAALALLEGGPDLMLVVIALYCAINFVLQSVIQPRYVGDAVGLSATVTFVSLVFWAWVLGAVGALLAVPLTLLAKAILLDADATSRWVTPLVGSGAPAEQPHAPQAEPDG